MPPAWSGGDDDKILLAVKAVQMIIKDMNQSKQLSTVEHVRKLGFGG